MTWLDIPVRQPDGVHVAHPVAELEGHLRPEVRDLAVGAQMEGARTVVEVLGEEVSERPVTFVAYNQGDGRVQMQHLSYLFFSCSLKSAQHDRH